jgi:hypothetical protein
MRPSTTSLVALALAALPAVSAAQGLGDAAVAAIPQYASVKIGTGSSAKTVSQLSVPLIVVLPITSRFNFDIATAYASSDVSSNGKSASSISGLTDTQVRFNWTLGNDAVVITGGVNIPTGQYTIPAEQAEAAGQIGNDFLIFPTSSYGSGFSGTGGVAFARSLGEWNLGVAGSFRKSTKFDAFKVENTKLTFTPADEMRARVGLDRAIGEGRLTLGATYSKFGEDVADNTSYSTGARIIGQGSLYYPVRGADVVLSGWNLYRAKGQQFGGVSNPENVSDGALSVGFHNGGLLIEPNVEGRFWQVDGIKAGMLANGGVRLRWTAGSFTIMPSVTYQAGQLWDIGTGAGIDVTGYRGSLMVRLR